ncbi:MAG: response regulator [Clostridia bacterium]|nr:response regulator [Clostridia bacterium]
MRNNAHASGRNDELPIEMIPTLFAVGDVFPGGFFVYRDDESQEIIYVNRAALRIFACADTDQFRELTGGTFRGLVHPDDYENIQGSIDRQIADESNDNLDFVEYRIIRRDGEIRWVDDYGRLSHLEGYGNVYYVFISDVTDKLRAEQERFKAELELEQEKRASEMKSAFLFNISHDIRTPMNAIIGFSDLAKRHADDPAALADCLDKVEISSKQMLALIDDILDMNSLTGGRFIAKSEPTGPNGLISVAVDIFRAKAQEKKIALEQEIDLPDRAVLLDKHRFLRLMNNLIDNAVKFTSEGGTVTVKARVKCSEGVYSRYEFSVADTGVGMSEEFAAHMFEAFEREENSTKSGAIGTGLGLSIVKALVDIMGGTITVQTEKGKGSVFTVELPLKAADADGSAAPVEIKHPQADGKRRLLLVEDVYINRVLAETVLTEAGFTVESVTDGCYAVDAVRERPAGYYDLVLMDIQMPVMNGYEATRAIRALDNGASLPILALSANAREEDKKRSLESGMNGHIAKPFETAGLVSRINEQINKDE